MNGTNGILNSLLILHIKNWNQWIKQMKSLFDFHGTLKVVTNGVPELAENAIDAHRVTNKEAKKKVYKVRYYIQSVLDSESFDKISHAESTNEVYDILIKYYEGCEKVKVIKFQPLQRQYELMQMREDEKVAAYVLKVQNLVHLMKDCGET